MRFLGLGLLLASSCVLFHEGAGGQGGAGAAGPGPDVTSSGGSGGSGAANPCTPSMTPTDPDNCGVCGHACGPGAECVAGTCGSFGRDVTGVVHDLAVFGDMVVLAVGGQKKVDALLFLPLLFDAESTPATVTVDDSGVGFIARTMVGDKVVYVPTESALHDLELCDPEMSMCEPRTFAGGGVAVTGLAGASTNSTSLYLTLREHDRLMEVDANCVFTGGMPCELSTESPVMLDAANNQSSIPPVGLGSVEPPGGLGPVLVWNSQGGPSPGCVYRHVAEDMTMFSVPCAVVPAPHHVIARGERAFLASRPDMDSRPLYALDVLGSQVTSTLLANISWPADTDGVLLYAHSLVGNSTTSRLKVLDVSVSGDIQDRGFLALDTRALVAVDASDDDYVVLVTMDENQARLHRWRKPAQGAP